MDKNKKRLRPHKPLKPSKESEEGKNGEGASENINAPESHDTEYSPKTFRVGNEIYKTIRLDLDQIEESQTEQILQERTQRVGESKESTIIPQFWNYYKQFNRENLPNKKKYFGGDEAELKLSILLNLFQAFYLERVYPRTFPIPIIQKSFVRNKRPTKFYIIGDTHGSFIDTVVLIPFLTREIEESEARNCDVQVVFVGDYVDRGVLDIHNLTYILTFNLMYPRNVLLLRGNHEELSICSFYGFGERVMNLFSKMLFAQVTSMFKDLPLICQYHCESGSLMVLHGGIPIIVDDKGNYEVPELNIQQFNNRKVMIEEMDDLSQQILWNDPMYFESDENYAPNRRRGIGYNFGESIFNEFCVKNHVDILFRGHQVVIKGIKTHYNDRFVTVFSAQEYNNKIIESQFVEVYSDDILHFKSYHISDLPSVPLTDKTVKL